jgi:hypothetical protein
MRLTGVGSFRTRAMVCHGWNVMVPRFVQLRLRTSTVVAAAALCWCAVPVRGDAPQADPPKNDYPTSARVEYVQECIAKNGGGLADLYKCSCAIDHMAGHLTYDDFVEAATFARYSTLGGEGGAEFRDPDRAREKAKQYRALEAEAYRVCGLKAAALTR